MNHQQAQPTPFERFMTAAKAITPAGSGSVAQDEIAAFLRLPQADRDAVYLICERQHAALRT